MLNKIQNGQLIYGDWRDEVIALGVPLNMPESKYASPMCPKHGWITMRKKKINVWQCDICKCKIELDEQIYREWRKKNANNLYSAVPPLKGSHCLTYKQEYLEEKLKWKPKEMELCLECLQSFHRCLAEKV
jgi:hypothetical protein